MPTYLRPTAPTAQAALLPGDPGRALSLAQAVLEKPAMSNHNRGLWGYHGRTAEGAELTIQSTGIGGPSAVAVVEQLAELGMRRAARVGNCRGRLELGTVVVVEAAVAMDGTSAALGRSGVVRADEELTAKVARAIPGAVVGTVATVDLARGFSDLAESDEVALDLATAPLLALAGTLGLEVAALLVVSEDAEGAQAGDEQVEAAALRAARAAAAALHAIERP